MQFIWKLMLRELKRNKTKVILSILIVLVLYMSAFTLCNVASALPYNFYRYYEQYSPDIISMTIKDADKTLYEKKDRFFAETEVDWDVLFDSGYYLELNDKMFSGYVDGYEEFASAYIDFADEDTEYTEELIDKYMLTRAVGADGQPIPYDSEAGVWIAKTACDALGISADDVTTGVASVNYVVDEGVGKGYTAELSINGIFDDKGLRADMETYYNTLLLMSKEQGSVILLDSGAHFEMYGRIENIDSLYDVYNYLEYEGYTIDAKVIFDMLSSVKNAEVICGIIGAIMLVGGVAILLNFINMFISSNIKHIALLRMLGAKTKHISFAYFLIFIIMISVVCLISWATLPIYNALVEVYCSSIGYPFEISINYGLVVGLFLVSYLLIGAIMLIKHFLLEKTSPNESMLEED